MGGEVGTVLLVHLITDRTKYHFNILAQQTSPARPAVGHAVAQASSLFLHSSTDRTQIIAQTGSLLGSDVGQQAYSLAISDGFLFVTFFSGLILLAVAFVRQLLTRFEEVA
jgi:DHA2 family multidrug resistance protein